MSYDPHNRPVYELIAASVQAMLNCRKSDRENPWKSAHEERAEYYVRQYLPTGSGFDCNTTIDLDASNETKLVFITAFHHMNEVGYYDGWTEHKVTVTPSFVGSFDIKVSGRNKNDIKDYIAECFSECLREIKPIAAHIVP